MNMKTAARVIDSKQKYIKLDKTAKDDFNQSGFTDGIERRLFYRKDNISGNNQSLTLSENTGKHTRFFLSALNNLKEQLLSLIYAKNCFCCGTGLDPLSHIYLCASCCGKLENSVNPPFCEICGTHIAGAVAHNLLLSENNKCRCTDCMGINFYFSRGYTASMFQGKIKDCLHSFKYKYNAYLAGTLAELMIKFAKQYIDMEHIGIVIPVPMHKSKVRQRGFNQAELLARKIGRSFDISIVNNCLVRSSNARSQTELERKERFRNVKGTFKVKNSFNVTGKKVMLIDDVFTTGATLNECSRILKQSGAEDVRVFTLSRGVSS